MYQKTLQNQRYASLRQSHVYPDNLPMVFIYRTTDLSCGTLINFETQNKVSDSIDTKRCHRFEVEESLSELLRRMKHLTVWIKNCIFYDRFSFMKPTAK